MLAKVQKWGNSQGLRLSKKILSEAHLKVGDEVDIKVEDDNLIVSPTKSIRGKYQLEDLVAQIPKDYQTQEVDLGKPVGNEVW